MSSENYIDSNFFRVFAEPRRPELQIPAQVIIAPPNFKSRTLPRPLLHRIPPRDEYVQLIHLAHSEELTQGQSISESAEERFRKKSLPRELAHRISSIVNRLSLPDIPRLTPENIEVSGVFGADVPDNNLVVMPKGATIHVRSRKDTWA